MDSSDRILRMNTAQQELVSLFTERSEGLERVARRAQQISHAPEYDDATTAQFLHGFAAIVREAVHGEGREARDLYNASAVAVLSAEGRSVGALARQLVTFAALLGEEIAETVDPAARADAIAWLADFMGEWTEELLGALGEAPVE